MSKKPIIGGVILAGIIGMVSVGAQINPDSPENEEVWSIRIAGPEFDNITNHRYSPITLERTVPYKFDFVSMGDSPERLKISVGGKGTGVEVFSELLYLEGTLVDTGISKYYTWDYTGNKNFEISFKQCPNQKTCNYDITVERYGNLKGSVSISLSQVDRNSLLNSEK
uniref:Secreted periplasmic Zn-dependent protease n=1 Tax=uncultured marine thaumarchaeote KM3_44_G08 TaxID=1456152 RepID=A0A075H708_9ARCH|nr:hypothetical protein [uncultured marine thaumarchaeote KM3_44_G08]